VLYAKKGRFKEAEEHFNRALAMKSRDAELFGDVGYFYYLASRLPEAETSLRKALELDPANRTYGNNLALVLGEQGRREESLAMFRRAATSEQQACANYAFVLAQRGEYKQAMDMYDHVLTVDQSMHVAAEAMIDLSRHLPPSGPGQPVRPPYPSSPGPPAYATQPGAPYGYAPQGIAPPAIAAAPAANQYPPGPASPAYATQPGTPYTHASQGATPSAIAPAAAGTYPAAESTEGASRVAAAPLPPALQPGVAASQPGAVAPSPPYASQPNTNPYLAFQSSPSSPGAEGVQPGPGVPGAPPTGPSPSVSGPADPPQSNLLPRLFEFLVFTVIISGAFWGVQSWRDFRRKSAAMQDDADHGSASPWPLRMYPEGAGTLYSGSAGAVPKRVLRPAA
jgi:hypothetical protein